MTIGDRLLCKCAGCPIDSFTGLFALTPSVAPQRTNKNLHIQLMCVERSYGGTTSEPGRQEGPLYPLGGVSQCPLDILGGTLLGGHHTYMELPPFVLQQKPVWCQPSVVVRRALLCTIDRICWSKEKKDGGRDVVLVLWWCMATGSTHALRQ